MTFEQDLQFSYFLLCFAFGYLFGLLTFFLDGFFVEKEINPFKSALMGGRIALLSFFFVYMKNRYNLGQLRLYMALSCILGFYIYLKTIAKIIAKFKMFN